MPLGISIFTDTQRDDSYSILQAECEVGEAGRSVDDLCLGLEQADDHTAVTLQMQVV